MTGAPVPDDIRAIIEKSLSLDAAPRYGSMGDMKQAISALATSGKYSATTFNLAFYVSNLLKKEFESESLDRDKESKVNVVPYAEALQPVAALPASHEPSAPMFAAITACERPATTSFTASLVALYGTCTMSMPVRPAKYAIERCVALPLPAVA